MQLIKFMKNGCVPCTFVENYLKDKGVEEYININAISDSDEDIIEKYGELGKTIVYIKNDLVSVPVLVLLNEHNQEIGRVSGYNPTSIDELLNKIN